MKKIFIILVMIVSSIFAKPLNGDIEQTNENLIQNTIVEEQVISSDNNIAEKESILPQKDIDELVVEDKGAEKNVTTQQEDKKDTITIKKQKSTNNSSKSSKKQEQTKIENEKEKNEVKSQPTENKTTNTQQAKKEDKPKQEEKKYCVDGGKVHIYGDGANEHGYYNTWDEAFKAYEEYTKGWESTQFKVDQCACGKYYFWVIK